MSRNYDFKGAKYRENQQHWKTLRSKFELWLPSESCASQDQTLLRPQCFYLYQWSAKFCLKGPESKYFRLRKPCSVCGIYCGPSISRHGFDLCGAAWSHRCIIWRYRNLWIQMHYTTLFHIGTKASMDLAMGFAETSPLLSNDCAHLCHFSCGKQQ